MSIQSIMQDVEKQYGKGSIMSMGSASKLKVDVIPTGCLSIDEALGVGGFAKGRIYEIFGPESSGKTTLLLEVIANAQAEGGVCAFVDVEHALDPDYATKLGVKMDNLLVSQPDNAEQALGIVRALVKSGELAIIALDSVAALVPQAELDGDIGDAHVGLQSRLMSQSMRMLTHEVSKSGVCLVFTNQLRDKIGFTGYGETSTTSGGRALKFYASVRIETKHVKAIKDGDDRIASRTKITVVKNKLAVPFKSVEVDIVYGKGIDKIGDTLEKAVEFKIVDKKGTWFAYEGNNIGQGKAQTVEFLELNPDIFEEIKSLVIEKLHPPED